MNERVNLERFIEAQESFYLTALDEIKSGRKKSHWIWYIFPQIQGLGFSDISRKYAIRDLEEATEYLNHPVLGHRLIEISEALLTLPGNNPTAVVGSPDDVKLLSCMTLFSTVENSHAVFEQVISKFFQGRKDQHSIHILNKHL